MASTWVQKGSQFVSKHSIIGTNVVVYGAWDRDMSPGILNTPYRTIRHERGLRFGKIGSDRPERAEEARQLIIELFPEAALGTWDETLKEITLNVEDTIPAEA